MRVLHLISCRYIKLTLARIHQTVGAHVHGHISRRVVAYAVKSRACTRANSLPPALFGSAKRKTQAHRTDIVLQDAECRSPPPLRLAPLSYLFAWVLSFSFTPALPPSFRIRLFSPLSPSNHSSRTSSPLPPPRADRWYRTCVRLRTRRITLLTTCTTLYYWHSRTTTSSGVSTTFRPDLCPRELPWDFFREIFGRTRFAVTRFMHAISSPLPPLELSTLHDAHWISIAPVVSCVSILFISSLHLFSCPTSFSNREILTNRRGVF